MANKNIVTNNVALARKYGASGLQRIQAALPPLLAADRARGIVTTVVDLSDKVQMAHLNAPVVTVNDPRQNKAAIDGVWNATNAVYTMILGAPDIVPHQPMVNPTTDRDHVVPSDLPYACDHAYSTNIRNFLAPTRMVGRLPGVQGATDPEALIRAISLAATLRPQEGYADFFAVCMQVKEATTEIVLDDAFGTWAGLYTSPPSGPNWKNTDYQKLTHVVACHGGTDDPNWYGDDGGTPRHTPACVESRLVGGQFVNGTIAGVQCCYGAQLYDPGAGDLPLCNQYVGQGATFFGSTTIGWSGRWGSLGATDHLNAAFLSTVRKGRATGDMVLAARQSFIASQSPLSPQALKAIGQFVLLGDPSLEPVKSLHAAEEEPDLAAAPEDRSMQLDLSEWRHALRQENLHARGLALTDAVGWAEPSDALRPTDEMREILVRLARDAGALEYEIASYEIVGGEEYMAAREIARGPTAFHVISGPVPVGDVDTPPPFEQQVSFVMAARDERIITIEEEWASGCPTRAKS